MFMAIFNRKSSLLCIFVCKINDTVEGYCRMGNDRKFLKCKLQNFCRLANIKTSLINNA